MPRPMTVESLRDTVEARIRRRGELKVERKAAGLSALQAQKLKDEARTNNRMLKQNRRQLAIAEGVERHKEEKRRNRFMGV